MNMGRLINQLEIDEGKRLAVYVDTEGYKTVGIGHMIKDDDPEWLRNLNPGESIKYPQMYKLFFEDLSNAIQDAAIVFEDVWNDLPETVQEVVVNMLFNLGRNNFLTFKKTIKAVYDNDWEKMAEEMMDSKWATQVGPRAVRLQRRVRDIAK